MNHALPRIAAQTRRSSIFTLAFALVALFTAAFVPGCQNYDELVAKDQACEAKWADYQADLQRRADLVGNLVETVKASAKYEESTLSKITQARAAATSIQLKGDDFTDPAKLEAFEKAQAQLSRGAISRLLVANENYPKLQATAQYTDLMKQLEGTENRILRSRQQYNEAVRAYNTELGKIRGSAINKATGGPFKPRAYFAAAADAQAAPKVSF